MKRLYSTMIEFDAGHVDQDWSSCSRSHGHHWAIEAEAEIVHRGQFDELRTALHHGLSQIETEWADRNINEMLHLSSTDPDLLAGWVLERLLLTVPTTTQVTVSMGNSWAIRTRT